jgi:hypothetical protein
MMSQQRAAERQAAAQEQSMRLQMAGEGRAAAEAARAAELQPFKVEEAKTKSIKDAIEVGMEFNKYINTSAADANSPEDFRAFAADIAANPLFQSNIFKNGLAQVVASIPNDPAQFPEWKRQTGLKTVARDKLYKAELIKQETADGTRYLAVDPYGDGSASVVPGSEINLGQEITYLKGGDGSYIPMPKRMAPAGDGLVGGARGGGGGVTPVATALQTNPGAIRDGGFARSQPGYAGASGGFATFDTPQAGVAAQENLLRKDYVGRGFNTINKIVSRYAPPGGENPPAAVANYKKYVAQQTGIDMDAPITAAQVPAIAAAMRQFETGQRPAGAPAAAPAAGGGIQFGVPIPGTSKPPKPKAGEISPEKKLARDRAVQDLYDAVVDAQKKGHLVSDRQSFMANRAQELRQGRAYLPGGTEQKSSVETIEATAAQLLRQLIEKGTSGTLNALGEQKLFLRSVGGADSTYETRMNAIRNFAKQNGIALNDYASDKPQALNAETPTSKLSSKTRAKYGL